MNELEELQAQKKEIERKIKELTKKSFQSDGAKLFQEYYACKSDPWCIAIKTHFEELYQTRKQTRWFSVVKCENRQDAIDMIDVIIRDLQELKKVVTG